MTNFFPPATAYDLFDALRRFGDPELVVWLEKHPRSDDNDELRLTRQAKEALLIRSVSQDIRRGSLVATCIQKPLTPSTERQQISADVWELLTFDLVHGSATVDALRLSNIKIQENAWVSRIFGLVHRRDDLDEDVEVEELADLNDAHDNSLTDVVPPKLGELSVPHVELTEKYGALNLRIGTDEMPFRGRKQKVIIKRLVEASLECDRIKGDDLLGSANSGVDGVLKAFRGYAHLDKFLKYFRSDHGWCWLEFSFQPEQSG